MLDSLNFVVAERMSFIDVYIQSIELDKECRKHIFPVYKPHAKYKPLILVEFSGAFAFLSYFLSFYLENVRMTKLNL
jgi:hypothetical protein